MTRIPGKTTMCPNNKLGTYTEKNTQQPTVFFSSSTLGYKVELICINVDRCFFSCQHLVLSILLFFYHRCIHLFYLSIVFPWQILSIFHISLFLFPVLNSIFIFLVSSTSHFIVIIFIVFVCLDYFIKDFAASKTWFVSCCCWCCCYLFCTDNSYIHFSGDFKDSSPVVIRTCHLTASAWIAMFVHFILPTALFPWPRTFIPQQFATVRCFFPSSLSLSVSFFFYFATSTSFIIAFLPWILLIFFIFSLSFFLRLLDIAMLAMNHSQLSYILSESKFNVIASKLIPFHFTWNIQHLLHWQLHPILFLLCFFSYFLCLKVAFSLNNFRSVVRKVCTLHTIWMDRKNSASPETIPMQLNSSKIFPVFFN